MSAVMLGTSHPDKYRREYGEYVCLDERYQHVEQHHEDGESNGHNRYACRGAYAKHCREYKYQPHEHQYYHVSGKHVGKETNHQREGFGEHPDKFNNLHERKNRCFQEYGHIGPEYLFPILLVSKKIGSEEGEHCQTQCNGNVAGNVGATRKDRNQPKHVVEKYKVENSEQVGCEALIVVRDTCFDNVVVDAHCQLLDGSGEAFHWAKRILFIIGCHHQHDNKK